MAGSFAPMATYNAGGFSPNRWLRPKALRVLVGLFYLVDRCPGVGRVITSFLRLRPVWRVGQTVLVTGDRQVVDVLTRDDDFPLPEKCAEKFLTGAFVLGMSRTPQFERERAELKEVVRRTDRPRIAGLVDDLSRSEIVRARSIGHLDVVTDLCTPVGQGLLQEYFGIRLAGDVQLLNDLRLLGAMVASPHSEFAEFRDLAGAAAVRVFERINVEIDSVEAKLAGLTSLTEPATVLERLVFRWRKGTSGFDRDRKSTRLNSSH